MISLTSAQLTAWLATLIYPLARIMALVASSPVLGNRQVPTRIKIGLGVMLTLIIAPTLDTRELPDPASAQGLLILAQQIVAGLMMGFSIRLIFSAIEMAGDIAGMQMGLGFANFFDPQNAGFMPIIAQFLGILVALAFVAMDLHLQMLAALAGSFQAFPISGAPFAAGAFLTVTEWGGSLFAYALQLSLPLIAALLTTNLALGILSRSAPQLNIFAVGFPITLAVGFGALLLVVPFVAPLLSHAFQQALETVGRILQQLGSS